jgi:hypothetical protein
MCLTSWNNGTWNSTNTCSLEGTSTNCEESMETEQHYRLYYPILVIKFVTSCSRQGLHALYQLNYSGSRYSDQPLLPEANSRQGEQSLRGPVRYKYASWWCVGPLGERGTTQIKKKLTMEEEICRKLNYCTLSIIPGIWKIVVPQIISTHELVCVCVCIYI